MFSRVKSAIANAVSGLDNNQAPSSHTVTNNVTPKFPYSRPHFLNLNVQEEVPLSADHRVRPIIVPRERDALPWSSGYAECVNSGKSVKNEDQATVYEFQIGRRSVADNFEAYTPEQKNIKVTYFGLFDGHAGFGAAVCAARQLHYIIEEKLLDVYPEIWGDIYPSNKITTSTGVCKESLVIGALERSFLEMDQLIAEDRDKYLAAGGCTALVVLCMLGKVFIANAGDSRAVHCLRTGHSQMSFDFTPETESKRIRTLAELKPELLCGEYSSCEYEREPKFLDLGKQVLFKSGFMVGWAMKTITKEDIKKPVITGEGKRSRVMNTIGVTRGFGDHDLRAINSKIPIKPFLSAHPEVNMISLEVLYPTDEDVLVLGTDGLWDVTSNEKAAEIVFKILAQFKDERHKYISAAQALVAHARGKPQGESSWRTSEGKPATGDDVSVFVIPLMPQKQIYLNFYENMRSNLENNGMQETDMIVEDD